MPLTKLKAAAAARDLPPLSEFLCLAVYSTNHAFSRAYKPLLDKLGLTYPQYLAMVALWEEDGQTVGAIGQKLFLESNTLTPLLKRLEALGHLARSRAAHDERQVLVHLTEKGRALRQDAAEVPWCLFDALELELEDLVRLRDDLKVLRKRLNRSAE
jgi:DNA-binding MarR family transcriptional regulator